MDSGRVIEQGSCSGGLLALGGTMALGMQIAADSARDVGRFWSTALGMSLVTAPWAFFVGALCGCAVAALAATFPRLRRFLGVAIAAAGLHAELMRCRLRREPAGSPA